MLIKSFHVTFCSISLLYVSYVLRKLIYFLSDTNERQRVSLLSLEDENLNSSTAWALFIDYLLISVFIVQHSFMASDTVKNILKKLYINDIERSFYNICSAAALSLLLDNWQSISWINIWNLDISNSNILWLTFMGIHIMGWFIIYGGCLIMDISEFTGFRQVCYKVQVKSMSTKSRELQRYYSHMRHPSFTGFLIILWIHPLMTLDRFLLAVVITMYMLLMWNVDKEDYYYQVNALRQKKKEQVF